MRKKVMVLLMIASLAGGALGFNPPPEGKRMNPEKMFEKMAKEVGLTGQQKDKFTAAAKQIEQEARIMRKKNRELFGKVEEEIQKDAPDRKLIQGYVQQINQNNAQIQMGRLEQIIQMRKELTPEQKGKLDQLMKSRKQRAIMHGKWKKPSSKK